MIRDNSQGAVIKQIFRGEEKSEYDGNEGKRLLQGFDDFVVKRIFGFAGDRLKPVDNESGQKLAQEQEYEKNQQGNDDTSYVDTPKPLFPNFHNNLP